MSLSAFNKVLQLQGVGLGGAEWEELVQGFQQAKEKANPCAAPTNWTGPSSRMWQPPLCHGLACTLSARPRRQVPILRV